MLLRPRAKRRGFPSLCLTDREGESSHVGAEAKRRFFTGDLCPLRLHYAHLTMPAAAPAASVMPSTPASASVAPGITKAMEITSASEVTCRTSAALPPIESPGPVRTANSYRSGRRPRPD